MLYGAAGLAFAFGLNTALPPAAARFCCRDIGSHRWHCLPYYPTPLLPPPPTFSPCCLRCLPISCCALNCRTTTLPSSGSPFGGGIAAHLMVSPYYVAWLWRCCGTCLQRCCAGNGKRGGSIALALFRGACNLRYLQAVAFRFLLSFLLFHRGAFSLPV